MSAAVTGGMTAFQRLAYESPWTGEADLRLRVEPLGGGFWVGLSLNA
jgi:hypothetical protein